LGRKPEENEDATVPGKMVEFLRCKVNRIKDPTSIMRK